MMALAAQKAKQLKSLIYARNALYIGAADAYYRAGLCVGREYYCDDQIYKKPVSSYAGYGNTPSTKKASLRIVTGKALGLAKLMA